MNSISKPTFQQLDKLLIKFPRNWRRPQNFRFSLQQKQQQQQPIHIDTHAHTHTEAHTHVCCYPHWALNLFTRAIFTQFPFHRSVQFIIAQPTHSQLRHELFLLSRVLSRSKFKYALRMYAKRFVSCASCAERTRATRSHASCRQLLLLFVISLIWFGGKKRSSRSRSSSSPSPRTICLHLGEGVSCLCLCVCVCSQGYFLYESALRVIHHSCSCCCLCGCRSLLFVCCRHL